MIKKHILPFWPQFQEQNEKMRMALCHLQLPESERFDTLQQEIILQG